MKKWIVKTFNQLTLDELYDALKLRIDVFVVEQTCFYPDLDDLDRHPETRHIFSYDKKNNMVGYARILAKGVCYSDFPAIGRVIIAEKSRGTGLSHELILAAIDACETHFPTEGIKISAQEHLQNVYMKHGFITCSAMYLEDGIPHVSMVRDLP